MAGQDFIGKFQFNALILFRVKTQFNQLLYASKNDDPAMTKPMSVVVATVKALEAAGRHFCRAPTGLAENDRSAASKQLAVGPATASLFFLAFQSF